MRIKVVESVDKLKKDNYIIDNYYKFDVELILHRYHYKYGQQIYR